MIKYRVEKRCPGSVRDAVLKVLHECPEGKTVARIQQEVEQMLGRTAGSSIRSYLRLNTPRLFSRPARGLYALSGCSPDENNGFTRVREDQQTSFEWQKPKNLQAEFPARKFGKATLFQGNCFDWFDSWKPRSIHAVVTDPPYGLVEYSESAQAKLRAGKGGVWRIPPSFDGHQRSPLPRFTVLTPADLAVLDSFFYEWASGLSKLLVPGAHVLVAANPLLSYVVAGAVVRAGLERRGEIIRLTMTMRGGDRPKHAHDEFPEISVMPRSMWEPWLIFRKPLEGRVQDNLRKWGTGGFRRPSMDHPFGDVIASSPTRATERAIAPHPSLKPQAFMRQVVRAVLPLGNGVILDPFAGAGSTLAAAEAIGYESIGVEKDPHYFTIACDAISKLAQL